MLIRFTLILIRNYTLRLGISRSVRSKGDACKTLMLDVIVEDTSASNHLAYVQEVLVKPQSYGGDTGGLNIPFQVSFNGARTKGYVSASTLSSGNPTFTAEKFQAKNPYDSDEEDI